MNIDIATSLRLDLGALNVLDGAKTPCGATIAAYPGSDEEAVTCVAQARRDGMRVVCAGSGAYVDAVAPLPPGSLLLSSTRMNRIIEHQPENLIISAEAGMTLTTLQGILHRHHQYLPLNPPDPDTTTLGGIVAAAATGSWRASRGAVRDWLLEVRGVDGLARPIHGGARVLKSVAGFDLPKLYAGSRGTLAFLTQATFKVRPLPEQVTHLLFSASNWETVYDRTGALAASDVGPAVIEIVRPDLRDPTERPGAVVTLEGSAEAVQWQITACASLLRGAGALIGRVDLPPTLPRGGDTEVTIRVKPTDTIAAMALLTSIGWRGAAACYPAEGRISLRCIAYPDTAGMLGELRSWAEQHGGAAIVERMPRTWTGCISPFGTPRPNEILENLLKAKLDPDGVFGSLRAPDDPGVTSRPVPVQ